MNMPKSTLFSESNTISLPVAPIIKDRPWRPNLIIKKIPDADGIRYFIPSVAEIRFGRDIGQKWIGKTFELFPANFEWGCRVSCDIEDFDDMIKDLARIFLARVRHKIVMNNPERIRNKIVWVCEKNMSVTLISCGDPDGNGDLRSRSEIYVLYRIRTANTNFDEELLNRALYGTHEHNKITTFFSHLSRRRRENERQTL